MKFAVDSSSLKQMLRQHVGVFGGRFDPPHIGHQQLVQLAIEQLALSQLWVIPTGQPVHKPLSGKASNAQRLAWLQSMFAAMPQVEVKDWEFQQQAVASIQTLQTIHKNYPDILPLWLMGVDAWLAIESWVDYPQHQQYCNVAVFQRGDTVMRDVPVFDGWQACSLMQWQQQAPQFCGHVVFIDGAIADVSASQIRADVATARAQGEVQNDMAASIQKIYE